MFEIFRKKRMERYAQGARGFVRRTYQPVSPPVREKASEKKNLSEADDNVRYSKKDSVRYSFDDGEDSPKQCDRYRQDNVKYSKKDSVRYSFDDAEDIVKQDDRYRQDAVKRLLSQYPLGSGSLASQLDSNLDLTFVDMLTRYINANGWRDSRVYKAAGLDRRLFSKIMSDREYKPAKDTALALAIALELTLQQTNDLLSRAGYTLSHSNKRDVIIEYFIREGVHDLADINEVLYKLDQKIIGR